MNTTSLTISLPEPLKAFVDRQVAAGTFPDADAYIQALLCEAQQRQAREKVEALLQEGLDSGPATEMTRHDWDDIRQRLRDRVAKRSSDEQQDRSKTAGSARSGRSGISSDSQQPTNGHSIP